MRRNPSVVMWRGGRVAEGSGLLNRRRDKISTEGSNPSLSATLSTAYLREAESLAVLAMPIQ